MEKLIINYLNKKYSFTLVSSLVKITIKLLMGLKIDYLTDILVLKKKLLLLYLIIGLYLMV
jgi:hypothetical protein